MDSTSKIILHLYGEHNDPEELVELLQNEQARLEYERLGAVKDILDTQEPVRPRAEVVDAIVAEAARRQPARPVREKVGDSTVLLRQDRPARIPVRRRRSIPALAGMAVTFCLLLGLGWWHLGNDVLLLPDHDEATLAADGVPADQLELQAFEDAELSTPTAEELGLTAIPSWDESSELLRLRRQMRYIQARSPEENWGEAVVPLEMRGGGSMPVLTSVQQR